MGVQSTHFQTLPKLIWCLETRSGKALTRMKGSPLPSPNVRAGGGNGSFPSLDFGAIEPESSLKHGCVSIYIVIPPQGTVVTRSPPMSIEAWPCPVGDAYRRVPGRSFNNIKIPFFILFHIPFSCARLRNCAPNLRTQFH